MVQEEENPKIIKEINSNIIQDKKQTSVRIPSELVSKFSVTPQDYFRWFVLGDEQENEISLRGALIKKQNDKTKDKG